MCSGLYVVASISYGGSMEISSFQNSVEGITILIPWSGAHKPWHFILKVIWPFQLPEAYIGPTLKWRQKNSGGKIHGSAMCKSVFSGKKKVIWKIYINHISNSFNAGILSILVQCRFKSLHMVPYSYWGLYFPFS